jgi:hypothetical protein
MHEWVLEFQPLMIDSDLPVGWRGAHGFLAKLNEIIQHFIVLRHAAALLLCDFNCVGHGTRAIIGSLIGIIHVFYSRQTSIEPPCTLLQMLILDVIGQHVLAILLHKPYELHNVNARVVRLDVFDEGFAR